MRPITSLALPAVSGTMMRIGFDGQDWEEVVCDGVCANACVQTPAASASPTATNQRRIVNPPRMRFLGAARIERATLLGSSYSISTPGRAPLPRAGGRAAPNLGRGSKIRG